MCVRGLMYFMADVYFTGDNAKQNEFQCGRITDASTKVRVALVIRLNALTHILQHTSFLTEYIEGEIKY